MKQSTWESYRSRGRKNTHAHKGGDKCRSLTIDRENGAGKRTRIHRVSVRVLGQFPPDPREAAEPAAVAEQALGALQPPHRLCSAASPRFPQITPAASESYPGWRSEQGRMATTTSGCPVRLCAATPCPRVDGNAARERGLWKEGDTAARLWKRKGGMACQRRERVQPSYRGLVSAAGPGVQRRFGPGPGAEESRPRRNARGVMPFTASANWFSGAGRVDVLLASACRCV